MNAAADPDVDRYRDEAMRDLGPYHGPIERNQAITAAYWKLYRADPNNLPYAKAAAIASGQAGLYLQIGTALAFIYDHIGQSAAANDHRIMVDQIAQGNIAIYTDIAWPLKATSRSDYAVLDRAAAAGLLMPLERQAFDSIRNRDIGKGNLLLVQHEQGDILQPILNQNLAVWQRQVEPGAFPTTFATEFHLGQLISGYPAYPDDSSFGDRTTRLRWAEQGYQWAITQPDDKAEIFKRMLGDGSSRRPPPILPPGGGGGAAAVITSPLFPAAVPVTLPSGPGGVDFSAVELRYVAERPNSVGSTVAYALRADAGADSGDLAVGAGVARDSLLTWLALPPSSFWVNLRPDEPDRVIDTELGRTAAGRIMLEADLRMKQTVAILIHPDSPTGRAFWEALRGTSAGQQLCFSFRQWITPGHVRVWATDEVIYILEAPLDVKLESDYLKDQGAKAACPKSSTGAEAEELFRRMILPKVIEAVNHDPAYGALRTIFATRVVAEWYGTTHRAKASLFAPYIGRGTADGWHATGTWSPREVFDEYVRSTRDGEFNVTRQTVDGNVIRTNTYFYGGVDFSQLQPTLVSDAELRDARPGLAEELSVAIIGPAGFAGGAGGTWAGGVIDGEGGHGHLESPSPEPTAEASLSAQAQTSSGTGGSFPVLILVIAAVAAALGFGVAAIVRRRHG